MTPHPFHDLAAFTRENEPMAHHTSFRVGGPVRYFVEPREWDALPLVFERGVAAGLPIRILGRGSNILVTDEPHPWLVISTQHLGDLRHRGTCIEAGAGLYLPRLVAAAEAWGLGGLEPLAGIPGSVGGAVAMNAGGRYGRVSDRLIGAMVVPPGGTPRWMDAPNLGFDYRHSIVPHTGLFVLSATFQLDKTPRGYLQERRLSILAEKHASQPMDAASAGCVFKNPPGQSAGRLIDQAGLKGTRVGGACVSHKHANFIVNDGPNTTATDVLQLIQIVAARVRAVFGVSLELEIDVWSTDQERSTAHA